MRRARHAVAGRERGERLLEQFDQLRVQALGVVPTSLEAERGERQALGVLEPARRGRRAHERHLRGVALARLPLDAAKRGEDVEALHLAVGPERVESGERPVAMRSRFLVGQVLGGLVGRRDRIAERLFGAAHGQRGVEVVRQLGDRSPLAVEPFERGSRVPMKRARLILEPSCP